MGRIFWIACAAVLVGAIGLWAVGTRSIQDEVKALDVEVKALDKKLVIYKEGKKEVITSRHITVMKTYMKKLGEEDTALRARMGERDIDLSDSAFKPSPPPRHSVAEFRLWMTKKYNERNGILHDKEIKPPRSPTDVGDVTDWEGVKLEDVPRILRDYAVSEAVFLALAAAEAPITFRYKVKGKPEENTVTERVIELNEIVMGGGGAGHAGGRGAKKVTFDEIGFTVNFRAHLNVAIEVIRNIESSKRGLFVVRSVSVKRLSPQEIRPPTGGDPALRRERERFANTSEREAPVAVVLCAGLLDYPDAQEGRR